MLNKRTLAKYLIIDKSKIAYLIALLIFINILPLIPCHSETHVTVTTYNYHVLNNVTYYNHTSIKIENTLNIILNDYDWSFSSSSVGGTERSSYTVSTVERISCDQLFLIFLIVFYSILAYVVMCNVSYFDRDQDMINHLIDKKKIERHSPGSKREIPCLDCGCLVPVMLDWSGSCPKCKRGYPDKKSWMAKATSLHELAEDASGGHLDISMNVRHWDKYQGNLDETADTVRKFRISYPLAFLTMSFSFAILVFGSIMVYSKISYGENSASMDYSGFGLITFWLTCVIAGFYTGKQVKKSWIAIPIIFLILIIAIYVGLSYGPILFNAHLEQGFTNSMFMTSFHGSLVILAAAMASLSRYYYS